MTTTPDNNAMTRRSALAMTLASAGALAGCAAAPAKPAVAREP